MERESLFIATFSGDAVKVAREYGLGLEINDLCISENLNVEKREWVVNRIKGEISGAYGEEWHDEDEGLHRKVIMHGPFTELTPAAIDPRAIDLMRDRYRETISICNELGIRDLVLHDGYLPLIYQKQWHRKKSIDFWRYLSDELPDDMTVYVENVFDDEPELLTGIVEEVSRDNIKICLDVGHANCMTISRFPLTEWVRIMAPFLGHFHLHNNDGSGDQHNDIYDGSIQIGSVLEMIEDACDPAVTYTIESREARPSAEYLNDKLI